MKCVASIKRIRMLGSEVRTSNGPVKKGLAQAMRSVHDNGNEEAWRNKWNIQKPAKARREA